MQQALDPGYDPPVRRSGSSNSPSSSDKSNDDSQSDAEGSAEDVLNLSPMTRILASKKTQPTRTARAILDL